VVSNLLHYYGVLVQVVSTFQNDYHEKIIQYESLLQSFDSDVERLQKTTLHPTLRHKDCSTLMDLFQLDVKSALEPWHQRCKKEWEKVKSIMAEVSNQLKDVKACVEGENDVPSSSPESYEPLVAQSKDILDQQKGVAELCRVAFEEFAPCVGGSDDADMSVYEELQRKFVTSIRPQLQTNCEILISALQQFQEMKLKTFNDLAYRVRRIVQHQSKINSLKRKLPLYSKIMERLDHNFDHLRLCHHLPEAYKWSLLEVVRRRTFTRLCMQRMSQYQETLSKIATVEIKERERFHEQYGKYLGTDIIAGLHEALPCESAVLHLRNVVTSVSSQLPPLDTPDQVTSVFQGVAWERDLGEPPESLLPAALEQYINTEAAGDESEDDCHSRRTPEAHVEQESSWKLLDKGEGVGTSLESLETQVQRQAATIEQQNARIAELERTLEKMNVQLKEEKEKQVVAVEASSSTYLDTLQRLAQKTHFIVDDLTQPNRLEALEEHIQHQECFKQAVLELSTRCELLDPSAIPTQGEDPSSALALLVHKTVEMEQSRNDQMEHHQRYQRALDALLSLLGFAKRDDEAEISFNVLEDILSHVADMKEEHSAQRSQLKEFRNQIKELRSAGVGKKLISLSSFGLGDTAIFLHKWVQRKPLSLDSSASSNFGPSTDSSSETQGVFEAIHSGTPNWYLSEETTGGLFKKYPITPCFVIVNILRIEERMADQDQNPFMLPMGTKYYEVVGEWVYDPVRSDMSESGSATKS
jgi:uncharacterized coiled-coil protein SlyX